ncbi:MAG: hydroxyacid dehydrogenase [Gammaproteobacteria bacterium RIFOXYA12_FULL_61_12]|nr:MAG: hydroxyacid dehydrogenase [Gammaproteobacteria bacterium RIFOXYD12_FULL_61_37]OGT93597.1 MAG: hydroxyacid dehydrogenase [Gammaproteobacteria bacterium RIFOXYA12_FULL_61_12]
MRLALLGTGLLGAAIARRLKETGHDICVWNRDPSRSAPLAGEGIPVDGSAAGAMAGADFILLALSDLAAIEAVLFSAEAQWALPGKTLIQMGTIAPRESRALAARLEAAGARYLEAPVLGSVPEALRGSLIIMAGGSSEVFRDCLPVLLSLGTDPRHIGTLGQGAALKLAMNQLIASLTTGFALSLSLVRTEGVAVEQFMELLRKSALYAPTFDKKLDKYLAHSYGNPNFPLKHLIKDTALFAQVAETSGIDRRLLDSMLAIFEDGRAAGFADQDYSALYEAVNLG